MQTLQAPELPNTNHINETSVDNRETLRHYEVLAHTLSRYTEFI